MLNIYLFMFGVSEYLDTVKSDKGNKYECHLLVLSSYLPFLNMEQGGSLIGNDDLL